MNYTHIFLKKCELFSRSYVSKCTNNPEVSNLKTGVHWKKTKCTSQTVSEQTINSQLSYLRKLNDSIRTADKLAKFADAPLALLSMFIPLLGEENMLFRNFDEKIL